MEAVQKTPEREAFYKKIDGENLSALWNVMGDLITPEPKSACRPHLVEIRRHPRLHERGRQADHRQGSRAAGAGAGKSGPARPVENHDVAVCRRADGGARRHRARAPPQPVGAALRARRQGRGDRGRRRAHADGARRFRHHAVDDLARPFQRNLRADVLARRARHPDGAVLRCVLCRRIERGPAEDYRNPPATALRATAATCCRSTRSARQRRRRSSTIPTATPARRWSRPRSATNGTPATG